MLALVRRCEEEARRAERAEWRQFEEEEAGLGGFMGEEEMGEVVASVSEEGDVDMSEEGGIGAREMPWWIVTGGLMVGTLALGGSTRSEFGSVSGSGSVAASEESVAGRSMRWSSSAESGGGRKRMGGMSLMPFSGMGSTLTASGSGPSGTAAGNSWSIVGLTRPMTMGGGRSDSGRGARRGRG